LEFYFKKRRWKILLLLLAVAIGIGSFFYTNWLVRKMAVEERKNVELWAEATRKLASPDISSTLDITFLVDIINRNTSIPIIIADSSDSILENKNISYSEGNKDRVLLRELRKMKEENEPIVIVITETESQYLYYRDSVLLENLKYYPVIQFAVVFLFILIAYLAFNSSRDVERNCPSAWNADFILNGLGGIAKNAEN